MKLRKESIAGMLLVAVSASVHGFICYIYYKTNCEKLGNVNSYDILVL